MNFLVADHIAQPVGAKQNAVTPVQRAFKIVDFNGCVNAECACDYIFLRMMGGLFLCYCPHRHKLFDIRVIAAYLPYPFIGKVICAAVADVDKAGLAARYNTADKSCSHAAVVCIKARVFIYNAVCIRAAVAQELFDVAHEKPRSGKAFVNAADKLLA